MAEPPQELIEVWEAVSVMVHALIHVIEKSGDIWQKLDAMDDKLDAILKSMEKEEVGSGQ